MLESLDTKVPFKRYSTVWLIIEPISTVLPSTVLHTPPPQKKIHQHQDYLRANSKTVLSDFLQKQHPDLKSTSKIFLTCYFTMGDGGTKCIKYLVFFFNFLFFVFGIVLLGFGIYAELTIGPYVTISSINYVNGSRLLIAVGTIIAVISFFGCCGAWKESKCMLIIFFVLLLVMLGLEIAAAVLGYKDRNKIEANIKSDIEKSIKVYPQKNKLAMDDLQKKLKCCGATGPSDWSNPSLKVSKPPESCKCSGGTNDSCNVSGYYSKGCADKLKKFLQDNLLIISALAITLLVIQILGMVFALMMICRIHKGTYA